MCMEHQGNLEEVLGCREIKKTFMTKKTTNEVIGDISLSIKRNEFVVLFGPGQCGKSTPVSYTHLTLPTICSV